jgi:hypothetical protein
MRVTPEDVQRVAQRLLDPERTTLVLVGPPGAASQLTGLPLGKVDRRPPPGPGLLPRKPAKAAGTTAGAAAP